MSMEGKKKIRVFEQGRKLNIRSQDDCDLLETDAEKENHMSLYRKNIMNFASVGKRRHNLHSITLNELSLSQL